MNRKKVFLSFSLIFILVLFSGFVFAQEEGILDSILGVWGTTNIGETYEKYQGIIDFLIYLTIFIGAAQFTLGKRFEGRGGKAVIIGMGFALAIALTVAQETIGFTIKSLGPVAAAIFLLIVAIMLFTMIKSAGMNASGSAAIAIVVVFLLIQAIAPNFFEWMSKTKYANIIYGIMWIAVIWAIVVGAGALFKGMGGGAKEVGRGVEEIKEGGKELSDAIKGGKKAEDEEEKEVEKEREILTALGKIGKRLLRSDRDIIGKLEKLKGIIKKHGLSATGRTLIAEKIEEIKPEIEEARRFESLIGDYTVALDRLKKLQVAQIFGKGGMTNARIVGFLTRAAVKAGHTSSSRKVPEKLREYVADQKRMVTDDLRAIEKFLEDIKKTRDLELKFINFLTEAINEINSGNVVMAESRIDNAISAKKEQSKLVIEEETITRRVQRIENHELKNLKNEKKLLEIVERELGIET